MSAPTRKRQSDKAIVTYWVEQLERELFPHQESEEESEHFTPEGRKRAAAVIRRILAGR